MGCRPPAVGELAYRHLRDDVIDQVGCRLRHAPRAARRADPRRLQLNASSLSWPHSPQRSLRKPCRGRRGGRARDRRGLAPAHLREAARVGLPRGTYYGPLHEPQRGADGPEVPSCASMSAVDRHVDRRTAFGGQVLGRSLAAPRGLRRTLQVDVFLLDRQLCGNEIRSTYVSSGSIAITREDRELDGRRPAPAGSNCGFSACQPAPAPPCGPPPPSSRADAGR